MKEYWHLLFEKFIDGELSDQEQRDLCELYESQEEFKEFWLKSTGQQSLLSTLKPNSELQSFLSSSLFIERKIKQRKRKKPFIFTFLKIAALLAFAALLAYGLWMKDKLPEFALNTSGLSRYQFLFGNKVELKEDAAILKFREGAVTVLGPASMKINFDGSFELREGTAHIITNPGFNFPVITPHKKYKDIGTEFGLKVRGSGSELHVFDGAVQAGEALVSKGRALLSDLSNDSGIELVRGGFFNEFQLSSYVKARQQFELQREKLLNDSVVLEYFDFSNLESAGGEISGLKKSPIKIKSKVRELIYGPYFGAKALKIDQDGDLLSFHIPAEVAKSYSVYVNFYYENYQAAPQTVLTDVSGGLNLSQSMDWFKKKYWKDGFMGEDFWKYRALMLAKSEKFKGFTNLEDVTSWKALPENHSNEFFLGNSQKHGLNFKGRVASIIILKSTDLKALSKLFNNAD